MTRPAFLLILLLIHTADATYGRIPGERYLSFLKFLNEEQRAEARGIIYDPVMTKAKIRTTIEDWAYKTSPLTMASQGRSIVILV
jgi:hypothetical protein